MVDMRQATSQGTPGHAFDRDETDFGGGRSSGNLLDFPQPARASAADLGVLQRVVAFEILPRVIRAHGSDPAQALPRQPVEERVSDEVKAFCNIVLSQNPEAAALHIEALRASRTVARNHLSRSDGALRALSSPALGRRCLRFCRSHTCAVAPSATPARFQRRIPQPRGRTFLWITCAACACARREAGTELHHV